MAEAKELRQPQVGALAAYKNQPACVIAMDGKKVVIELAGSERVRVRPKDITLLHPGPVDKLPNSPPAESEVLAAWELLTGESTTLRELADLIFGAWTPAAAWAVFCLLVDGLYFRGEPDKITTSSSDEVVAEKAARREKAAEQERWTSFLIRVENGAFAAADAGYLRDVEDLALGRTEKSRILSELGQKESPEAAHALLLRLGYWDETVNPYPARGKVALTSPSLGLPDLPDEDRLDLSHLAAYAIDDESTADPDDAISFDGQRLWVHIADAAALVAPDSPVDEEARSRGANLYLPEGTITMLPPAATALLGIGLAEKSAALSIGIELSADGEVVDAVIKPSWVKASRMTYSEAEERLGDDSLWAIHEICGRYGRRRREKGAIEIELPEVRVRVIEGRIVVDSLPALQSRELVKEAMLMAGNAVAHFARAHDIPVPFLAQERPAAPDQQAASLSAMYALRRSMKPSHYTSSPTPHAGLGLELYVQVTSPLRRYLDLLVHQQLRAFLRGRQPMRYQEVLQKLGAVEAVKSDLRFVERRSNEHWQLVYLLRNPGWQGEGVVIDNSGSQATILLPAIGLEASIYQKQQPLLDQRLKLELVGVDLPNLIAHFRPVEI